MPVAAQTPGLQQKAAEKNPWMDPHIKVAYGLRLRKEIKGAMDQWI